MSLICWRGLLAEVPVFGSNSERLKSMTCVPVLLGSKNGSPLGTGMLAAWAWSPLPPVVRSMSWSMNWPQA